MSPSSTAGSGNATTQKQTRQVAIHVKITASSSSSAERAPKYVSPATNGVLVQVYTSPRASNPAVIGVSATDVSPGSAACGGATGTRTCTIYIPAPAGSDDFVFTTYDQAPTAGATTFPAGANILAVGVVTQTISLGGTNTVNVALGGVIASLGVVPLAISALPGGVSSYDLAITGYDADYNTIIAGTADPYYNPVTVAVSEVGGSGYTSVTLGGESGSGSGSVQVSMSSQTATVLYTGGGTSGYGAQIAVSAQGVSTATATFGPFFVSSSSPNYSAASRTASFTSPGQTAVMNLSEYGFSGTFTAMAGASCTGIATVSAPVTGTPSAATITAGSNSGTCTVTFADGNVSVPVTVGTNYTSSTITIPGASTLFVPNSGSNTVSEFAPPYTAVTATISNGLSFPRALAADRNGNVFVANSANGNPPYTVTEYAPPYTGAPVTTITNGIGNPVALALDSAGDLFVANNISACNLNGCNGTITEYAPPYTAAPVTTIASGVFRPYTIALNSNGTIVVVNGDNATISMYAAPYSGGPTTISNGLSAPRGVLFDRSGNLVVANYGGNSLNVYAPPYTGNPTVTSGLPGPWALAMDLSGNLFVANYGGYSVMELAPPYTAAPTATITSGISVPNFVAVDAVGNLFVANQGNGGTVLKFVPPYTSNGTAIATGVQYAYALLLYP